MQMDPPLLAADDLHPQAKIFKHIMSMIPPSAPSTLTARIATSFEIHLSAQQLTELCSVLVRVMRDVPRFILPAFL